MVQQARSQRRVVGTQNLCRFGEKRLCFICEYNATDGSFEKSEYHPIGLYEIVGARQHPEVSQRDAAALTRYVQNHAFYVRTWSRCSILQVFDSMRTKRRSEAVSSIRFQDAVPRRRPVFAAEDANHSFNSEVFESGAERRHRLLLGS